MHESKIWNLDFSSFFFFVWNVVNGLCKHPCPSTIGYVIRRIANRKATIKTVNTTSFNSKPVHLDKHLGLLWLRYCGNALILMKIHLHFITQIVSKSTVVSSRKRRSLYQSDFYFYYIQLNQRKALHSERKRITRPRRELKRLIWSGGNWEGSEKNSFSLMAWASRPSSRSSWRSSKAESK